MKEYEAIADYKERLEYLKLYRRQHATNLRNLLAVSKEEKIIRHILKEEEEHAVMLKELGAK